MKQEIIEEALFAIIAIVVCVYVFLMFSWLTSEVPKEFIFVKPPQSELKADEPDYANGWPMVGAARQEVASGVSIERIGNK